MFSKTCEYGIRAVIYIAATSSPDKKIGIAEISKNIEAPSHFTAKILQTLVHSDLVCSQKGINGGFYVDKPQKMKQLIEIVHSLDGDVLFKGCGLGLKTCSDFEPCPLHEKFKTVRNNLKKMMEQTTVDEMAKAFKKGKKFVRAEDMLQYVA